MEKHISFDDLMKELRVTDPKRFHRRLEAYGFQLSKEYDKRTANEIADRFDIKIPWHNYKHEQVVTDEGGPLTQGLPAAIANKIEGWFGKLQNSLNTASDFREPNPGKSIFDYQVRILMGPEVRFNLVSWECEKRLRVGRAYIRRRDGEVLEVHPLMSYQTCRTCMADRLFLLDNVEKLTAPGLCSSAY